MKNCIAHNNTAKNPFCLSLNSLKVRGRPRQPEASGKIV